MKQLNFQLHTIIMLIGPSGCGKSTFAEKVLIPQLYENDYGHKVHIPLISSDEIRKELIGPWYGKHEDEMLYCSDQAFKLLYMKVDLASSYPVNSPFIIVDTTGLSNEFRQEISKIAIKNHYTLDAIVFSYGNKEDYTQYLDKNTYDMRVVFNHIKRLNQDTLKELCRNNIDKVHKIKSKDFLDYKITVGDLKNYNRNILKDHITYTILGDVHGCLEELKSLIIKNNFLIEGDLIKPEKNRRLILVGDLIDKGPNSKGVLDFVCKNIENLDVILGNHENFVLKFLKGQITGNSVSERIMTNYFNTTKDFLGDTDAIQELEIIVKNSHPFLKGKNFIVTHSPCKIKYLGKIDKESKKHQRKFDSPKRDDFESEELYSAEYEKQLSFLKEESVHNHPFHIFGHDAFQRPLILKNKIGIDTDCAKGGKLTSITILNRIQKFFNSVPSLNPVENKEFSTLFSNDNIELTYVDLAPQEVSRIRNIIKNKVNFISGTMCPAEKDIEKNDIESIDTALRYYKDKGVKEVILQTKYMGSRCTIYLFKDIEKCYATSRKGYIIKGFDLTPIYTELQEKLKLHMNNVELFIIDGELMPWYAMGKGLIDNEYRVVEGGIKTELDLLEETNFEKNLWAIKEKMDSTAFEQEVNHISKKELAEKYTHSVYSSFKCYLDYSPRHITLSEQNKLWETYSEQLKVFGSEKDLHYKAFALLKTVYEDGSEVLYFDDTNEDNYTIVNDDPYLIINLDDVNASLKANNYFKELTENQNLEGIVMKPNDKVYIRGVAPFRKIRNKKYLTIIYGYDFTHPFKYEKLLRQKSINRKLSKSIKEFELGKKMLEIPWREINNENKTYFNLVANMISEEKNSRGIDPRL